MRFGLNFFPSVRPEQISAADYYADALEICELGELALLDDSRSKAKQRIASSSGQRNVTPRGLLGSPADILETVATYREAGIDTFHLQFAAEDAADQMRQFAREVMPKARALAATG